jgi:hypothetical protein
MKKSLGIYISNWNVLGGVESFIQNFCKRMNKHYKISLLFDWVENNNLLFEYSNYVDIIKIDKSKIYSFDYFINSTAWGFSPFDNIESKKVIHSNY